MRIALILILASLQAFGAPAVQGKTNVGQLQVVESKRTQTANTIFEVSSTTRAGVPAPVMTNTQMNAISSPTAGMMVYDSTNNQLNVYTTGWNILTTLVVPNSSIVADTPNGHGSTNTKIRRWTNQTTTGSDITYTGSAGNGDIFTINTAGIYNISYTDRQTAGVVFFGISLNSNQLTTGISTITTANRLMMTSNYTNSPMNVSASVKCAVNDVIRAHTEGTVDCATAYCQFRIVRIY